MKTKTNSVPSNGTLKSERYRILERYRIFEMALRGAVRELEQSNDDYAVGLLAAWHDLDREIRPFITEPEYEEVPQITTV